MINNLTQKIEAILFYLAEPVSVKFLVKFFDSSTEDIDSALKELDGQLKDRGIKVIFNNDEVVLTTATEYADIIEKIVKEERERDLGRAGIETLSIVAYKGPVTKKEIEYIRGVNSQYALRNLLLRGLIEKKEIETDLRSAGYVLTIDALRFLGLNKISDLPEYDNMKKQLEVVEEKEELEENIE